MEHAPKPDDDLTLSELLQWAEIGCWSLIVLFPMLYYVNGPAVSPDQFVMHIILIVFVVIAAPLLRWRNWRASRRERDARRSTGAHKVKVSSK